MTDAREGRPSSGASRGPPRSRGAVRIGPPPPNLMWVAVVGLGLLLVSLLFFTVVGPLIPCSLQSISYALAVGIILSLVGASLGGTAAFQAKFQNVPVVLKVGGGSALLFGAMFLVSVLISSPECASKEISVLFQDIPTAIKLGAQASAQETTPVSVQIYPTDIKSNHNISQGPNVIFQNWTAYPNPNTRFTVVVTAKRDTSSFECKLEFEQAEEPEKGLVELLGDPTPQGLEFRILFSQDGIAKKMRPWKLRIASR